MKTVSFLALLVLLRLQCAGAPFVNLDFQSPNTMALAATGGVGGVPVKDAIPGWMLQTGDQPDQFVLYNTLCETCPSASLYGPVNPRPGDTFTFGIRSGILLNDPNHTLANESVYQTGTIPGGTRSFQFISDVGPSLDLLHVYLGGQELQLVDLATIGFGHLFGADVSLWGGDTAELRFTIDPGAPPFFLAVPD